MEEGRIPYIAGLLDGEGGFSIIRTSKNPPNFHAHISLQMTHKETVERFAEVCGVTYNSRSPRNRRVLYYALVGTKGDLEKLLGMLSPWLITKKRHAELIRQFLSLKRELQASNEEPNSSTEKNIRSQLVDIHIELRKLNHKDPRARRIDYDELQNELQKKIAES
jgi:hypothetical protein